MVTGWGDERDEWDESGEDEDEDEEDEEDEEGDVDVGREEPIGGDEVEFKGGDELKWFWWLWDELINIEDEDDEVEDEFREDKIRDLNSAVSSADKLRIRAISSWSSMWIYS